MYVHCKCSMAILGYETNQATSYLNNGSIREKKQNEKSELCGSLLWHDV